MAFGEEKEMGCKRVDEREGKLKGKGGGEMDGDCGEGRQGWREGGREAGGGGREGKGRRVDLWGLKHISIHGEEEATDSRETEGPD